MKYFFLFLIGMVPRAWDVRQLLYFRILYWMLEDPIACWLRGSALAPCSSLWCAVTKICCFLCVFSASSLFFFPQKYLVIVLFQNKSRETSDMNIDVGVYLQVNAKFFSSKIFWKNKRLFICIVRLLKDPNVCWISTEQLQVLLQYLSSSSCKGWLRFRSSYCILALNALRWTKCLGWVRSKLGELCEGYSMVCVFNCNLLKEFSGLIFFIMWGDIYCAFSFNQVGKLWIF